MSNDKDDLGNARLGHDPLEWLDDDEPEMDVAEPVTPQASSEEPEPEPAMMSSGSSLMLPEKLVINDIEDIQQQWYQFLLGHHGQKLEINGTQTELVDGAGLQLLFAFVKKAHEELSKQLSAESFSSALKKAITQSGMHGHFSAYVKGDLCE